MKKGQRLFVPSSHQLVISGDVIFEETIFSVIAEPWKPFHDSLTLRAITTFISDPTTVLEMTGSINSILPQFEEGKEEIVLHTTALNTFDDVIYTNAADCQGPAVS